MASAPKKKVQDINGDQFFPITHVNAVINDDGDTLDVLMSTDVKQVNIGATPYTPTVGVVTLPSYPSAPGTLVTNKTTAQTASAGEAMSGTINLHKIAKTGTYSDLIGTPTIPSAPGTLNTNNATAQTVSSSEALSGTVKLHKVSKTGTYSDLIGTPASLPASDVYAWAKAATKPSYDLDEIPDGTTRALANFLRRDGGNNMTANAAVSWGTNDRTDWGTFVDGIRVMSSTSATSGAPVQYSVGINIKSRYGFSIASHATADRFFMKREGQTWRELYQANNANLSTVDWACKDLNASGAVNPGSDTRIKDDQKVIGREEAFRVIGQLRPKTWVWNRGEDESTGKAGAGLVAQDVKEVLPDAVHVGEGCGFQDFHSLNYNTIQGYEIAAIKALIEEVEALRLEVAELKKR